MTNQFKSFLAHRLEEYIHYRKTLGFKDTNLRSHLRCFDLYLVDTGLEKDLNASFFLEFRKILKGVMPRTANGILSSIKGFFNYMVRNEYVAENPLQDIPSYKENAFIPFIFSPEEIDGMLHAVQKRIRREKKYFFNDMMVYTTILLLARCGMRISEPLGLHSKNYRSNEGTIYIEKTKFYKDRLIPVPKNVVNELNNYCVVRNTLFSDDSNHFFFPGKGGSGISDNRIYPVFHQAVKDIGRNEPSRVVGNMHFGSPTPHSLRHSFATNTLINIKDRGRSPQQALPVLSSYMGHSKYRYTVVYLKLLNADHRRHLVDFSISKQEEL